MNKRTIAVSTALISLALPASAFAHGSVFQITAYTATAGNPSVRVPETQYVVTNHGFTYVLRETNGETANGMINFKVLPSAYRNRAGYTKTMLLSEGDTGAQPHATCRGVAALDAEAAVLAWQDADPFYNYVPFQTTSAGLEDSPARWLAVIKDRTGLDLKTAADPATACAGLGGTYKAADLTVTTATALASGTIEEAKAPLEHEITTMRSTATADIAKLMLAATPLKVAFASPSVSGAQLTSAGTAVSVTGPPLRAFSVRLTVSQLKAKALGLKSTVLARQTVTTAADGSAQVQLKVTGAAARAIKRAKGSIAIQADAISGDRYATSNGKVTK